MLKLIVLLLVVCSLSSCASHQIAEKSCEFVKGTYESDHARKKQNDRNGQHHEKDNIDVINGILALFTIKTSGHDKKCMER